MKIAAGVLTHNAIRYGRLDLLKRTIRSLSDADLLYVVDNGSTDGTEDLVRSWGGTLLTDAITTCGHGMNATIGILAGAGELAVFSNDDIEWRPGWRKHLEAFWADAPDDLMIASGLLEDDYPWNTIREQVNYGGVPALIRDTAPGGCWTLRAADWPSIAPVPEAVGWDDVPTCERIREHGKRVAQIDLCTHIGGDHSVWGNGSEKFGKPLDPELRESLQLT